MLCQSLEGVRYHDCELPSVRRVLADPEGFLESSKGAVLVLDEIHRLANPSELLKIAADHYPETKVIATGSSTLGASAKFRDTLTGRKNELWLTPMILDDLASFGNTDLPRRFLHGGLPPFFLATPLPDKDFQEWFDAYWAKDIQELFRLQQRHSFLRFAELLIAQSGGIFEASSFAAPCEVSRTTISNYLAVLETTYVAHVIRPFSTRRQTEIVSAPRVYSFDTGFVCYFKGWEHLRPDDFGLLWEHLVLNELMAHLQTRNIFYWRDKQKHEIDFVLSRRASEPLAIECKWSADEFDAANLRAFRKLYPAGRNYVVAHDVKQTYSRKYADLDVQFVHLPGLISALKPAAGQKP